MQFTVSGEQLIQGAESAAAEFPGNGIGAREVSINNSKQTYRLPCALQLVIDAGMIAPERARSNDGYIDDEITSERQ